MNKTKRIALLVVIIAVVGAIVLIPLLKNKEIVIDTPKIGAEFSFKENLATKYGEKPTIGIKILEKDIAKIELIYNDSLLKTWNNPTGELSYVLAADCFGIGTKIISLQATFKDGTSNSDTRFVRVLSDISPLSKSLEVVQSFPHDSKSFVQGLEFSKGVLFESTGQYGQSKVHKVNLTTGKSELEIGLDGNYFGEGITILNDKIFQLTWQEGRCFVYDKNDLKLLKDFKYNGEGWGLCNNGTQLIMSDGSERLVFRNPTTFQIEKTIEVYDDFGPRERLNELEYIDGKIYANIWMLDIILVIDPATGKILEEIDGSAVANLARMGGEAMNGIAFNATNNKLYVTGKNWGKLVEVKIK